jgi:hypothetical protein
VPALHGCRADVATAMINTHALNLGGAALRSPVDSMSLI